jgi:hypothetical protein
MFTDLDSVVSYLANVISAFQCMFNCAHTQAKSRPLLYDCIMTLFNFVTSKKAKDWFKDHAGKMPLFPTYIALLSDKLFVGFVKSAENYTNQCTAKDGAVTNLDMADLSRAIGTFYNIVKEIKKFVDYDKLWVDYPAFLLPPDTTPEDPPSSGFELPPPWTWPLATEAVAPAAGAALDAATAMLAVVVVVAAAQAALAVLAPGAPGLVLAREASETPQARAFATTKVVTSSWGARATPLEPSAPRLATNTALNTPPMVISAATPTAPSSMGGLTTTRPTSKLSSWLTSRQTRPWSSLPPTATPRWPYSRTSVI